MLTDAVVSEVIVMLRANNSLENRYVTFNDIPTNELYTIEVVLADEFGTDAAIWPLHFEGIIWYLDRANEAGARYITLPGISEVFAGDILSTLPTVATQSNSTKYMKQDMLYIQYEGQTYNVLGTRVK
jgi:hypothetical protein